MVGQLKRLRFRRESARVHERLSRRSDYWRGTVCGRTHRIGGWLIVLLGIFMLVGTPFLEVRWTVAGLLIGAVGIVVWSMVYSYLVWPEDPDKIPPGRTLPAD